MKQSNFPGRKAAKRRMAEERAEKYAALSLVAKVEQAGAKVLRKLRRQYGDEAVATAQSALRK